MGCAGLRPACDRRSPPAKPEFLLSGIYSFKSSIFFLCLVIKNNYLK